MTDDYYANLYKLYPGKGLYIHRYIKMDRLLTSRHSKCEIQSRLWFNMDKDMDPLWLEILGDEYLPLRNLLSNAYARITKQKLLEIVSQFHAILYKNMTTS